MVEVSSQMTDILARQKKYDRYLLHDGRMLEEEVLLKTVAPKAKGEVHIPVS